MGTETKNDCPFCAENARARREDFERDVLPDLEKRRAAHDDGSDTKGG